MTHPETHPARDANDRFNAQVDALLRQDQAGSVLELIERPRGLERFLKLAAPHLQRPYSELELNNQKNPCYAQREKEFYDACEQIGLEIPFRTQRLMTEQEKHSEAQWKYLHRAGHAFKPEGNPPGFSVRRNTPRIDQYSAMRLSDYATEREAHSVATTPMRIHVIHGPTMKEAMMLLTKAAPKRSEKSSANHVFICVAPDVPDEELWKGHSMVAAMIYTPGSKDHAEAAWIADPLPVHARVDAQEFSDHSNANMSVSRLMQQVQIDSGPATKTHIVNLPMQEEGHSRDLNCRLYSEALGKAFIRIGRENPNLLLQPDVSKVESALKRRLPDYYEERTGAYQLRPRGEIIQANQQRRWEMGSEVLAALTRPIIAGKSL